ncbi:hypothetical protein NM688_g4816 [Phlebia brevispora]|uniref:Uncharacterized protein n=1 Tax=Phlebia brevispora TaxID=194682 RepID=A0ACC1T1K6_9APHY|nr:hypothetical protein NM688_g4816 [Phlebia brevispora]
MLRWVTTELHIQVAVTVWVLYDHVLTFHDEVRCIWRRKPSRSAIIYVTMRYSALLFQIMSMVQNFVFWNDTSVLGCTTMWRTTTAAQGIFYFTTVVFSSLRIYAISGQRAIEAVLIFGLGMIFICCSTYVGNIGTFLARPSPLPGCFQYIVFDGQPSELSLGPQHPDGLYSVVGTSGIVALLLAELIVQCCTWRQTWAVRCTLRSMGIRKPLLVLLLRDGAINYLALTLWALLVNFAECRLDLQFTILPFVSVSLTRLLLRLRRIQQVDLTDDNLSLRTAIISAQVIGNLGEPLEFIQVEREDEEILTYVDDTTSMPGSDLEYSSEVSVLV